MFHDLETLGSIHPIHNWEYADAAAREAASGFALTDLKKVALQLDSLSFWVLVDVGGGPSGWSPVGQTVGGFTSSTPADQLDAAFHAQDGGASDAYAITLSPAIASYVTGTGYRFKANTANTGAATLNINGLGAQAIKKAAGGITTDLSSNDIRAGQWVEVVWDGTNFQMQSTLGNAGGGFSSSTPADQLDAAFYAADGGASDAYAITLSPAIASYVAGTHFIFKANTANTGAATLNINALGAQAIKKAVGGVTTDLDTNDIRAGQFVLVVWDGTNFQMLSLLGNAAAGGSGTVTNTGNLDANRIVLGNAAVDVKSVAGLRTDGTSVLIAGTAGATEGGVKFENATSGSTTIVPATGALGTGTQRLLPVSGTLAAISKAIVTTTGTINDLDFSNASLLQMNNTTDSTINGLLAGKAGQRLTIVANGNGWVFLTHKNVGSSAANRILNPVAATISLSPGSGSVTPGGAVTLEYDDTIALWRVVSHTQGAVVAVPYAGGNFTGSGSLSVTVASGDQVTFSYMLVGRLLTIFLQIDGITLSGTGVAIQIAIPGGFVSANALYTPIITQDNGTFAIGFAQVTAAGSIIYVYATPAAPNWAGSTNNSAIRGQFMFPVQ